MSQPGLKCLQIKDCIKRTVRDCKRMGDRSFEVAALKQPEDTRKSVDG